MIIGFGAIVIFMAWIIGWLSGKGIFSDDEESMFVGILAYAALFSSLIYLCLMR